MALPSTQRDENHPDAQHDQLISDGLSFEAEPTGLGDSAVPGEEAVHAQGDRTSRPGLTPGSPNAASPRSALHPKGLPALLLILGVIALAIIATVSLLI